uniref:Uncharacterized protein n=1 Tax=Sphaeramia orbicularis TaxID=375764 RepID=A0A672ZJV8_9TELE
MISELNIENTGFILKKCKIQRKAFMAWMGRVVLIWGQKFFFGNVQLSPPKFVRMPIKTNCAKCQIVLKISGGSSRPSNISKIVKYCINFTVLTNARLITKWNAILNKQAKKVHACIRKRS